MTTKKKETFLYEECERFDDSQSLDDYKAAIVKYLMLCDWNYTEEAATATVSANAEYIEKAYAKKETVGDIALDIGYCCG